MPPQRQRGPYKRYLREDNVRIPRTTAWRMQRRQANVAQQVNINQQMEVGHEQHPVEIEGLENNELEQPNNQLHSSEDGFSQDSNESIAGSHGLSSGITSSNESESEEVGSLNSLTDASGDDNSELNENEAVALSSSTSDSEDDAGSDIELYYDEANHDGVELQNQQEENVVGENNIHDELPRNALYEGARISQMESDILIMSFIIRWGLEERSIDHLLQLIDLHLPTSRLGSKYLFLKRFPTSPSMKVRYFCPECDRLLPETFETFHCACGTECNYNSVQNDDRCFVEISITEQIKAIMSNSKLVNLMRKNCEESDVVSGSVYKRLRDEGLIGDDDITLQWNTDGVKPFKSSKVSLYPVQALINELPYNARRDNMILCGLYCGKRKPPVNSFLKPFVGELETLHSVGVECSIPDEGAPRNVKVHCILSPVDSVARPMLQGIQQFNGKYGCSFCLKPGKQIRRGRGRARVFKGGEGDPRTYQQHIEDLDNLETYNENHRPKKKHFRGVKHRSVLLLLSMFNIISSFVPEYLHAALEGVVKTFLIHWQDYQYEGNDWYLNSNSRNLLNERLKKIMPPVEITRSPRSLKELKLWKASELRSFLLYYSLACLKGILRPRYFKHWFLFVYGMTIFLKEKISRNEFLKARTALVTFVEQIQELYPNCPHLYTFNVHLLLHVPTAVHRYGALWASSTFPFEHLNGVLGRLYNGTQSVSGQICRSYLRLRDVSDRSARIFARRDCSVEAKKLYEGLVRKYSSSRSYVQAEGLRLFGAPKPYNLSVVESVAIRTKLGYNIENVAVSHTRLIFQNKLFHAMSGSNKLKVRNNSTAQLRGGLFICIVRALVVTCVETGNKECIILGEELEQLNEELAYNREIGISSNDLCYVCHSNRRIVAHSPLDIMSKCVIVPYGNASCVIPLVNRFERD